MTALQISCLLIAVLALSVALVFHVFRLKKRISPPQVPPGAPRTMSVPAIASAHEEPVEEANARYEVIQRMHGLALTSDTPPTSADEQLHEQVASGIRWTLTRITEQANYAPRRPLLLPKLVAAMNDDDTSRRELVAIITSDPSLAGTLLGLANSPYYRIANDAVESLDRAIAVLGIEGMRSLVAAAVMQPVFRVERGGFPRFGDVIWQHTLSAATAAQAHASTLERADPFAAQLLVLMMGMAAIVVFRVAVDQYESRHLQPLPRIMLNLLETQTVSVARQVAASWQLTERIDVALSEQNSAQGASISALGRSLQFGRFLGALDVLNQRQALDEHAVMAALRTSGSLTGAYERIWGKRTARTRY